MEAVRALGIWVALVGLVGGVAAVAGDGDDGTFDRDDAIACVERAADTLGQPIETPNVVEGDGSWEVSAAGRDGVLRLVIRTADERITEVVLLGGGRADILQREERLAVLEDGC